MKNEQRALRVLVVDDDSIVRDFLYRLFNLKKIPVTTAESGMSAVELLLKEKFDVALLDIKMPYMNGLETYRRLREIHPGIECILMTGYIVDDMQADITAENLPTVIRKPFEIDEIMAEIERISVKMNRESDASNVAEDEQADIVR